MRVVSSFWKSHCKLNQEIIYVPSHSNLSGESIETTITSHTFFGWARTCVHACTRTHTRTHARTLTHYCARTHMHTHPHTIVHAHTIADTGEGSCVHGAVGSQGQPQQRPHDPQESAQTATGDGKVCTGIAYRTSK